VNPDLEKGRRFLAAKGPPHPLVAGVTGAHYYGFPSPDSDLDVKGIHVAPTAQAVALAPLCDTIDTLEIFEGLEIDYTSHELAAALRLLLKGNGNILERILSPLQLLASPEASTLQDLARGAASRRFHHHYRGFFGRMREDWNKTATKTVKGLLYTYRSALTGIHLLRTGDCVGDVTALAARYSFDAVAALVERKGRSTEHGLMADSGEFEADLAQLEAMLEASWSESPLPEESPNAEALNEFLVDQRRRHFTSGRP
jgi:predicted nucleotidyltransferase